MASYSFMMIAGVLLLAGDVPLAASPFLRLPVSAKSVSLAGAFSAGDDLGAVEQNPSSLLSLRGLSAEFTQSRYFEDTSMMAFSGGYSSRKFGFAFNYKSYSVEDISRNSVGDDTGKISHSESVVGGAVALKFMGRFSGGIGFKSLGRKISDNSPASGINTSLSGTTLDFGLTYYKGEDAYSLSVANFGGNTRFDYAGASDEKPPLTYYLGARHTIGNFVGLWQVSKSDDNRRLTVATGVDYDITRHFALRLGMKYTQYFDFTFGLGFKFSRFYLNYALSPHMDFGATHNVTLGVGF